MMEPEEEFSTGFLGAHLTTYALDPNLTDARRAEARRILALECAMSVAGTVKSTVKAAKEIETFLRGSELRAVD